MAKVKLRKGLDQIVAQRIVRPHVDDVVDELASRTRQNAPQVKRWNTVGDNRVRDPWHVDADGQEVPENLKFELESHPWDMGQGRVGPPRYVDPIHALGSVGPRTWLTRPRERVYGVWVNIVNCRCYVTMDRTGISRHVRKDGAVATGTQVKGAVWVRRPWIVEAEYGDVYDPPFTPALGTHFMRNSARQVAARTHIWWR